MYYYSSYIFDASIMHDYSSFLIKIFEASGISKYVSRLIKPSILIKTKKKKMRNRLDLLRDDRNLTDERKKKI